LALQDQILSGLAKYRTWHEDIAKDDAMSPAGKAKFMGAAAMIQKDIDYIVGYEDMVNNKEVLVKPYFPTAPARAPLQRPQEEAVPEDRQGHYCGPK
jgi:hypothetical protein